MADLVAFFGKNCNPNLITKKKKFQTNWFLEKKAIFEKSEKIIVIAPSITQVLGI